MDEQRDAGGSVSAATAIDALRGRGLHVATAESLTGGQLAARFTQVPGSSAAYLGGVVSYATELKVSLLGVPAELVERHGVISAECAEAMARGVRRITGADCALSTTGVAGPDLQEGHRPGTVFVGVCVGERCTVLELSLEGARGRIQAQTCDRALRELVDVLTREEIAFR